MPASMSAAATAATAQEPRLLCHPETSETFGAFSDAAVEPGYDVMTGGAVVAGAGVLSLLTPAAPTAPATVTAGGALFYTGGTLFGAGVIAEVASIASVWRCEPKDGPQPSE